MNMMEGKDDAISRRAAIEVLNKLARDNFTLNDAFAFYLGALHDAADGIKALPAAQPQIVRCKDCVNREYCRTSTLWAIPPKDDWYCADAERRTDG